MVAMAPKYERRTLELPADWEAIGRLVREETLASMATHIESLAALFDPAESGDSGLSGLGGRRS